MEPLFSKLRGRSKVRALINILAILAVFGTAGYFLRNQINAAFQDIINQFVPCSQPITYSIGTFDTRFGISKTDFLNAIGQAEQIWETPIHKQLFTSADHGSLKINLVYDQRQSATIKLQQAGIVVHDDQASYNQLETKYTSLLKSYRVQKTAFDTAAAAFDQQNQAYAKEVARLNSHGGASQTEYDRLQREGADLQMQARQLNQSQTTLNQTVDTLNNMVQVLNRLATTLNLAVDKYNTIGATQGGEFEEGVYTNDAQGAQITVYQFDDKAKLVRVLAHELGHALGLDHLDSPAAVMYRLNVGMNAKLTTDDIAALKKRCRIQ